VWAAERGENKILWGVTYPEFSCCKHPSTLKGEKQVKMFLYWCIQRILRGRMLTAGQLRVREASDGESGWIVTNYFISKKHSNLINNFNALIIFNHCV